MARWIAPLCVDDGVTLGVIVVDEDEEEEEEEDTELVFRLIFLCCRRRCLLPLASVISGEEMEESCS